MGSRLLRLRGCSGWEGAACYVTHSHVWEGEGEGEGEGDEEDPCMARIGRQGVRQRKPAECLGVDGGFVHGETWWISSEGWA